MLACTQTRGEAVELLAVKTGFLLLDLAATNSDDRILSLYTVPLVLALWRVRQVRLHLSAEKKAKTLWAG